MADESIHGVHLLMYPFFKKDQLSTLKMKKKKKSQQLLSSFEDTTKKMI